MNKPKPHVLAFLLTSGLGISFLVFLNAAQPFVLRQIVQVPSDDLSKVSSTLIFCDELLALIMVLLWGRIADKLSPRTTTAIANLIVALALVLFVQMKAAYPGLLSIRLLFSVGASGITTMLSATLNILCFPTKEEMTPAEDDDSDNDSDEDVLHGEGQPLLGWRRRRGSDEESTRRARYKPAAIPAFLGISAGLGALLAVFVFLRIPTWLNSAGVRPLLASGTPSQADQNTRGLKIAFYIVASIAVLNSIIAFFGLPKTIKEAKKEKKDESLGEYIKHEVAQIFRGFKVAKNNAHFRLACAGGFAARAQTISVSAFLPLYVASYYFKRGVCDPNSGGDLKESCHEAYALASAISGVTQLVALMSGVLFVWVVKLCRTLSLTSFIGCVSFAILGRSAISSVFGAENPKHWATWVATIGIGLAQTGSVTTSLAMMTKDRMALVVIAEDAANESGSIWGPGFIGEDGDEIAGALAGVYSFCGGLGVLSVSALARILSNRASSSAPFLGIAGIDFVLAISAFSLARRIN